MEDDQRILGSIGLGHCICCHFHGTQDQAHEWNAHFYHVRESVFYR